jgi:hypothetical protein
MTLRMLMVTLVLGGLLTACGRNYWQGKPGGLFMDDSAQCIEEAKGKYDIYSQDIYRACMRARDWRRVRTQYPTYEQFRGPENQKEFANPPSPWSKRGPEPRRIDDPTCNVPTASRPEHCRR